MVTTVLFFLRAKLEDTVLSLNLLGYLFSVLGHTEIKEDEYHTSHNHATRFTDGLWLVNFNGPVFLSFWTTEQPIEEKKSTVLGMKVKANEIYHTAV